mmetsp:Transcript_17089/g.51894  ORF Transcript_17089/g.51894 Transcript_17089/m.51894 type:complete len:236 (-) Transcript_17089:1747-2454(-)
MFRRTTATTATKRGVVQFPVGEKSQRKQPRHNDEQSKKKKESSGGARKGKESLPRGRPPGVVVGVGRGRERATALALAGLEVGLQFGFGGAAVCPASPVGLGRGVGAGFDGDEVAVLEFVGELDFLAVDEGGGGVEADVGVDVEGGVEDGGPATEVQDLAVSEEDEDAFPQKFAAHGLDELARRGDLALPGLDRVEPRHRVRIFPGRRARSRGKVVEQAGSRELAVLVGVEVLQR